MVGGEGKKRSPDEVYSFGVTKGSEGVAFAYDRQERGNGMAFPSTKRNNHQGGRDSNQIDIDREEGDSAIWNSFRRGAVKKERKKSSLALFYVRGEKKSALPLRPDGKEKTGRKKKKKKGVRRGGNPEEGRRKKTSLLYHTRRKKHHTAQNRRGRAFLGGREKKGGRECGIRSGRPQGKGRVKGEDPGYCRKDVFYPPD